MGRNILRGGCRDAELRTDIRTYVDLLTDEKIAAGVPPEAARRAARLEFGSIDAVTEEARGVRAGALLAQIWQDTRYAARMARRDIVFSLMAIATLALGIGANTAIFSVVNGVLLRPLAYSQPDRLVIVWERNLAIGKERDPVAPLNYLDWRSQNSVFDEVGAYRYRVRGYALNYDQNPEQLSDVSMSSSLFRVLRSEALVGRVFTEDEERRGDRVVVLTHELWTRRFGGQTDIVGRSIPLNGAAYTVVGVMPSHFTFPDGNPVDIYSPLLLSNDELTSRGRHVLTVIGRLKDGVAAERARTDLGGIARRIASAEAGSNPDVTIVGAHDALVENVRLSLLVLFGTVGFVLLIACANVANLVLVRASARRREMAMRAALGAGRSRLIRQVLTESVLLSVMGAVAGTALAWWLLRAFAQFYPPDLPRIEQLGIDTTVLAFVTAAAFATGVAFGIIPALQAATPRLIDATRVAADTAPARRRTHSALLVAEIATSLILLAGAGLMARTLIKLQQLHLGFEPDHVLTAQVALSPTKYPVDPAQFRALPPTAAPVATSKPSLFYSQLEEGLRRVPGIEAVGAVSALPLNPIGTDYDLPVIVAGKPRPKPGQEPQSDFRVATPGYFRAMRMPLLAGREFTDFDGPNSTPVAVINETMARLMFADENSLGQRLILYGRPREIIGVVGSVRHHGFSRGARPEMILPYRQFQFGGMTLVVRSAMDQATVAAAIRGQVRSLDSQQPVYRVRTMDQFLADSMAQPRFTTLLLAGFAAIALLLALVGVYGVTSYSVSQRGREIAVRLALGAQRSQVLHMVMQQSLRHAALGVLIGIAGAIFATRFMAGLLFGISATDPPTLLGAAAALLLAALAATYIPALRAARATPVATLRGE